MCRRGSLNSLVCALTVVLAVWGAAASQPSPNPELEGRTVRQLRISSDGPLTRISQGDLFKLIEIREGQPYSASASRRTLQRLHTTQVFHDIQIQAEPAGPDQVDVSLLLIRRYHVRELRFEGKAEIPHKQLRRAPTLRIGRPFESDQLEESVARLKALYQRNGFFQASVDPEFKLLHESAELDVMFQLAAGPQARVGELRVDVEGDPGSLTQLIESQPGRPYSEIQQEEDLARLKSQLALDGYLEAQVYISNGPTYRPQDNLVDLTFRVVPRRKTEIEIVGLDWKPERLARLPLYQQSSSVEVFLQETVDEIRESLQREEYYLAKVEYQKSQNSQGQVSIQLRVNRGDKQELESIELAGVRSVELESLRSLLTVEPAGWLNGGRFTTRLAEQDRDRMVSFYQQRGYLDASADFELTPSGPGKVRLVFRIDEKDRYYVSSVSVQGALKLSEELVRGEIQAREGEPFSPLGVARDRASIAALYENRGYRQVELRSQLERLPDHRVAVAYVIVEGEPSRVDEVIVTGRRRTREQVIRREIILKEGMPLSLEDSLQTEANLYGLAVFNRVQVQEAPSFKENQARLTVIQLEEARRFTLLYGIGYSSFEGPRGTLGITDSNFLGQARSLAFSTRLGQRRQRANVTYTLPRFTRFRLPTVFSISADNEEAQTRRSGNTRAIRGRPFDSFTLGGAIQAEKRLSRRESLFFRYQFERTELDIPRNLAAPLEFFREEERLSLSTLGLSYLNDSRDDASDPQQGFFLSGDLAAAGSFLGSQEQLGRIFLQGQYYRKVSTGIVWASAVRIGLVGPFGNTRRVPISQRFFSGGASTLRGLPQDLAGPLLRNAAGEIILVDQDGNPDPNGRPVPLGGDALLILNNELRFPIWKLLRGALFYDVGNVFREFGELSFDQLSHAVGFGFHFSTPIGPLRFDIGYNPDPPPVLGFKHVNFHVTLGHPF